MATNLGSMFVNLTADPKQLIAGMSAAKTSVGGFGSKLMSVKTLGIAAFAGIGIAAGMLSVKGIKAFGAFEESMANVSTLVDTAVVDMDEMNSAVRDMSKEFGRSTDDMANGLYQIVSAGIPAAESTDFLAEAAKTATAGVAGMDETVLVLTKTLAAYGLPASAAGEVSDKLFTIVKNGQTTFAELANALPKTTGMAAQMGIGIDELGATFSALTKLMANPAEAATSLAGVMRTFLKPTEDMNTALADLGYESAESAIKQDGLMVVLDKLNAHVGGSTEAWAKLAPNIRGIKAILPLTGKAAALVASDMDSMAGSAGATEIAYKKQAETMAFQTAQLKQNWEDLKITIGESLMPAIQPLIDILKKVADWFANLSPSTQTFIAILVPLTAGIVGLVAVIYLLNVAFLALAANPIVLIIAAIVIAVIAVGVAIYKLWTQWDKIWAWIMEHKAIAGIIAILMPILIPIFAIVAALKFMQGKWGIVWVTMKLMLAKAWNGYLSILESGVNAWLKLMEPIFWIMKKAGLIETSPKLDLTKFKKDTSEMEAELAKLKAEQAAAKIDNEANAVLKGIDNAGAGGTTETSSKTVSIEQNIYTQYPVESADELLAADKRVG